MAEPTSTKRSIHELKRLVEDAVNTECGLPCSGLWFCVTDLHYSGRIPSHITAWCSLHFTSEGSPFCCGEPGCHLGTSADGAPQINDHVRRAMGLSEDVSVDLEVRPVYHDGIQFHYGQLDN